AGVASVVTVCACMLLLTLIPAPVGRGTAAPRASIGALSTAAVPGSVPGAGSPGISPQEAAVRDAFRQVRDAGAAAANPRAVPANLDPSLVDAPADKAAVFVNGCTRSWREVGQSECAKGDTASPTTVALIGDSHAAMWDPALQQVVAQRHWRLET